MSEPNNLEHAKAQLLAVKTELEIAEKENVRLKAENTYLRNLLHIRDTNEDLRRNRG